MLLAFLSKCGLPPLTTHQSRVSNLVSGPAHFGQVPEDHWHQPPWINETKATEERWKMIMDGVPYSDSISCGFPLSLSLMWAFLMMGRMRPDIAICVGSIPGCDLPLSFAPHVSVLTKPTQFFFRHPLLQDFRYYWRVEWVSSFILTIHPCPFDLV